MDSNWGNTALVAYSLLPKIIDTLDFALKSRINSSFQSRHLKIGVSNEQLIGEILEINDRKRKIVNLAYIVKSTLERMKPKDKHIVEERIFKKKTFQTIAAENGIALRTAFRRFEVAKIRFSAMLVERGYTDEWFEKEYGAEKYLCAIKSRLEREKYLLLNSRDKN